MQEQVGLHVLHLLPQGDDLLRVLEQVAQQVGQGEDELLGLLRPLGQDGEADGVQAVEEEVGVDLGLQRLVLGLPQ